MWPWEHVVVGYLSFSVGVHVVSRRPPTAFEATALAVASVSPDLIDKPLAWQFSVFPSGYGAGHSVFFAVPLAWFVLIVTAVLRRPGVGAAFGAAYGLHLIGDVVPDLLAGDGFPIERVLWPVFTVETTYEEGFAGTLLGYLADALDDLLSGPPSASFLVVLGLTATCVVLWLYDGMPGVREPMTWTWRRLRDRGE